VIDRFFSTGLLRILLPFLVGSGGGVLQFKLWTLDRLVYVAVCSRWLMC
jgi:hypothetical protein